jgi:hypothetical protein
MSISHRRSRSYPIAWLSVVASLLLLCLAMLSCSQEKPLPQVYPAADSPLTAAVDGRALIVTNNSDQSVYYLVFPTDILPVIEWAPCLAPETCPAEQTLDPGQARQLTVRSIIRDGTESITVFWWIYLERVPGASIPPMEMKEFIVPLP